MEPDPPPADLTKRIGDETSDGLLAMAGGGASDPNRPGKGGDFIGPYRLVAVLGEGGFGTVWRAEQEGPIHREVALKVVKRGMDSAEIIARFEAERQALALMEHPNIASVLDAGTTANGRPYFVMELVKGVPVTEYCDAQKFSIRQRLELFIPVCQAVQHAHQKAILHRDLKPSNILVTEVDGKPVPKVIDFGIAKALGTSAEAVLQASILQTQAGAVIGTPQYMSPEQAGARADMDTRSDIYTLGVILYELLTGCTPLPREALRNAAFHEVLRLIRESQPVRPSSRVVPATEMVHQTSAARGTDPAKFTRSLRGELDWITLKALEKERERRYESASALAQDIERHLRSEPVEAGPPSALYRFRKLVRRNRLAFAASAIIVLLLVAGIAVSRWQAVRARQAEALANAVSDFLQNDILRQASSDTQADTRHTPDPNLTVREALDRASKSIGERFSDQPLVEAAIRSTIGRTYNELGLPKIAMPQLSRASQLQTQHLGADHPEALRTRMMMGNAHFKQGDYAAAESEYRAALAICERALGAEHATTLNVRNNLGGALRSQDKSDEAEKQHRAVLAIRRRVLGEEHPLTLASRQNLIARLWAPEKNPEVLQECRAILTIRERVQGPDHPETLLTRETLAVFLNNMDKFAEAEKEVRSVLAARERTLGPAHPETLQSRSNLALYLNNQGKAAEAEKERRALLAIRERTLGAEHPETLTTRFELGYSLECQSNYAEAEREYRAVIAIRGRAPGAEHAETPETLPPQENEQLAVYYSTCRMLAGCLHGQNKREEALLFATRALAGMQKVLKKDDPQIKVAREMVDRLSAPKAK